MKPRLIDVIMEEFNRLPMTVNAIYTLDCKKLETSKWKFESCEEFKNCQLVITPFSKVTIGKDTFDIRTYRINHQGRTDILLGNGIFYLYQINTSDFVNFDIRGYFFAIDKDFFQNKNLEGLTDEQKDKIKDILNTDVPFGNIQAKNDWTDHLIKQYKLENAAQDFIKNNLIEDETNFKKQEPFNKLQEKDSYTDLVKEISTIEKTLNDCDGLDDDQIIALKDKIKNFEAKLKDKVKPKTITISSSVHNKIKKYCNDFNLKIGDWVEDTLLKALDCTDTQIKQKYSTYEEYVEAAKDDLMKKWKEYQTYEEYVEAAKDDLMKKWKEYQKINKLIKSDNLILKPKFKFKGFSFIDHKPMYDYLGTDAQLQKEIETIKCKIYLTTNVQELSNPIYIDKFAETPVEGFDVNIPGEDFLDGGSFGDENPELFEKLKNMFKIK